MCFVNWIQFEWFKVGFQIVVGAVVAEKQSMEHAWIPYTTIRGNDRPLISPIHDNVIKWKHFPRNWPFVRGFHWLPVNSPHKGQWRGALSLGVTTRWLQLQPTSAWPRPTVSAFQYFRWCAPTKHAVSHFLRRIYIYFVKGRSLVITVDVAVDPSFLVIGCRKYSPPRWLQQMVTMVATDVPGGVTRVARQFWRTCLAGISRNMFGIFMKLSCNAL